MSHDPVMSAAMLFSHPLPPSHPTTAHESRPSLSDRVALDLNLLRSKPERPSTIRIKRSALQPAPKAERQPPPPSQLSSRQLADQRLEQALGGQFDYIGARSMLHRLARTQATSSAAQGVDTADGALSESIMTRVRSLAATTTQNASLALSERAAQESARRRSRTKPLVDPPTSTRTKHAPIPLSELPPSMIPIPRPPITQFVAQPAGPPSPTPTAATAPRRTDRERERDKSPLRAPNKFYNVRVSQNPIFLRRTSIKPPHLASLPIPAPPLPAPPMAGVPPAQRPRSPVRRPKPAPVPAPTPVKGTVRAAARSARTTSVALQTYLASNPPIDPRPIVPTGPPTTAPLIHLKSKGVQADDMPTHDAKDSWTMTDPPAVVDRATAASPVHVGRRAVGCQADFEMEGPAATSVASQTEPPKGRGRTVALDTRDMWRPVNVAVQTDAWAETEEVHVDEDWARQAQAELLQWVEMQVLLRLVSDEIVDHVAAGMVAELVRDVVTTWPVTAGTQAVWPIERAVQAVEEPRAVVDGATQVTPSVTPPRKILPNISVIPGIDLGVQTSFGSLPTISEIGEGEEDIEVDLHFDQATQDSIRPSLSNASVQVSPTPSSPSSSTIDEPTPTLRQLVVPPATPHEEPSYHSIGVQGTRTPTPPLPELAPTPSLPTPRVPTPGTSLPPPSSIHPSTPRSSSPGLVPEPSATTIHTYSASMSMSMDVSEGEVVTGLYSDGEVLSGILAPSAIPGLRNVSADTTADGGGGEFGAGGHLVAYRHGDELDKAVEWVREQQKARRKRRVVQRMRLRGLSQRMTTGESVEASLETSGISLDDGEGPRMDMSLLSVGEEQRAADMSMGEVVGTVVESEESSDGSRSSDSETQSRSGSSSGGTPTAQIPWRSDGALQGGSEETFVTSDESSGTPSGNGPSQYAARQCAPFL